MTTPRERVAALIPALKEAIEFALAQKPGGKAQLAVVVRHEDGSGLVSGEFEFEVFLADLEALSAPVKA